MPLPIFAVSLCAPNSQKASRFNSAITLTNRSSSIFIHKTIRPDAPPRHASFATHGRSSEAEPIFSASELRPCVAKLACLGGASGRMVLWIKIEDDLFVKVIAELKRLAFCEFGAHSDTAKIGSGIARR